MPPGNCDTVGNRAGRSREEEMLSKVMQWAESTNFRVKAMKGDLLKMNQTGRFKL